MNKMKTATIVVLVFNLLTFKLLAQEGRVTIHVVGENGFPIANAKAGADFDNALPPGTGAGSGKPNEASGITDSKGFCVLIGHCNEGSVGIAVMKEGYYGSDGYGVDFENSVLGLWQPWN